MQRDTLQSCTPERYTALHDATVQCILIRYGATPHGTMRRDTTRLRHETKDGNVMQCSQT